MADEYVDGAYSQLDDDVVPTNMGLAPFLGVATSTIEKWGTDEDKPLFSGTLARLQEKQKKLLLNKGLTSEFNSNIAKLMLGNHGYSDKSDNKHTHDFSNKTDDELRSIIGQ